MAIAQRMRQPVPPPLPILIGVVALVIGVAALMYTWISATSPATVPYSQFLGDVEAGQVSHVTQVGTTLEVSGPLGDYRVTLPTILTDVYADIEHAATEGGAAVPLFAAQPAPDTSWIGLVLTAVLPVALLLGVIVLVFFVVMRPARAAGARSLANRLRELDEAYRAGLISEDERHRQRTRILDEA
jgi:FtsH Extracellular